MLAEDEEELEPSDALGTTKYPPQFSLPTNLLFVCVCVLVKIFCGSKWQQNITFQASPNKPSRGKIEFALHNPYFDIIVIHVQDAIQKNVQNSCFSIFKCLTVIFFFGNLILVF